jgi:hypothetical protein
MTPFPIEQVVTEKESTTTTKPLSTLDDNETKLDNSVVEQLVLAAAVASLPTPTSTIPPTPIIDEQQANIQFTDAQIEQINVAQAQAIAQAAANYQHLFATLSSSSSSTNTIKKENSSSITQKVRQENRERKKRWRQQHGERNKDNDLRCRVNKRAHKLFGKEDSPHKQKLISDEFSKRRSKRKEKEDRKQGNHTVQQQDDQVAVLNGLLSDPANYISLLANSLGAAATNSEEQKGEQFTTQLLEFLQQQSELNEAVMNNSNDQPQLEEIVQDNNNEETKNEEEVKEERDDSDQKVDYPMDAVLTLMQLNAGWRQ